jgi:hypothetical protein
MSLQSAEVQPKALAISLTAMEILAIIDRDGDFD